MKRHVRLGINIDHVATLRNARGENYPEVTEAARIVEKSGADLLTVHVREDRRHINEKDLGDILNVVNIPVNLEIGANLEMEFEYRLESKDSLRPGHDIKYGLDSVLIKNIGGHFDREFKIGIQEVVNWYMNNKSWID